MSVHTLSSVLEKHLQTLCLRDFPCGRGSWSKTEGSEHEERRRGQKDRAHGPDKVDQGALVELLTCPRSPWQHECSWSPQAPALRELSVTSPKSVRGNTVSTYFTILRIVDQDVEVIDDGLLKFSNLKELFLSANKISQVHGGHLPCSLRVLELHANQLSNLKSLCHQHLAQLQHLGLGSNCLGSRDDLQNLTGTHWPGLVSLDLSWGDFQDQRPLVKALATLPCLRSLFLEGNPMTLAPSYPGLVIDSLQRLWYLDAVRLTPQDRHRFRGLVKMSELMVIPAAATVSVNRVRGIPKPPSEEESVIESPIVEYSYFVTYEFLACGQAGNEKRGKDTDIHKNPNRGPDKVAPSSSSNPGTAALVPDSDALPVSTHTTPKHGWAECIDFTHTGTFVVHDLHSLNRFLNRGLRLRIKEEKVVSWPMVTEDVSHTPKDNKGVKGKDIKVGGKDKPKDKKKPEMVKDAPVTRTVGSAHVCLQDLMKGNAKMDVTRPIGLMLSTSSITTVRPDKDSAKKRDDKRKDDKKSKAVKDAGAAHKIIPAIKDKVKGGKDDEHNVHAGNRGEFTNHEQMTMEFSVMLEKWQSASEAHGAHSKV